MGSLKIFLILTILAFTIDDVIGLPPWWNPYSAHPPPHPRGIAYPPIRSYSGRARSLPPPWNPYSGRASNDLPFPGPFYPASGPPPIGPIGQPKPWMY